MLDIEQLRQKNGLAHFSAQPKKIWTIGYQTGLKVHQSSEKQAD